MKKLPVALTLAAILTLGGLTGCHDEADDKPIDVPPPVAETTKVVPSPSVSVSASPSKSVSVSPSISVMPDENTNDVPGDGGR